jgi:hypothetical protein
MGFEAVIGIVASLITTMSGIGWMVDRNGRRTESRIDTLLAHMTKVERVLNDMRAELPLQYTLKDDHLRLQEKVFRIENHVYQWGRRPFKGDDDDDV